MASNKPLTFYLFAAAVAETALLLSAKGVADQLFRLLKAHHPNGAEEAANGFLAWPHLGLAIPILVGILAGARLFGRTNQRLAIHVLAISFLASICVWLATICQVFRLLLPGIVTSLD